MNNTTEQVKGLTTADILSIARNGGGIFGIICAAYALGYQRAKEGV